MEQSLQRTGPDEIGIERRGQDGPSLLFAHAYQQKPCIRLFASLYGLCVLGKRQCLACARKSPCRRLTVVFALLQELRWNVKLSFVSSAVTKAFFVSAKLIINKRRSNRMLPPLSGDEQRSLH